MGSCASFLYKRQIDRGQPLRRSQQERNQNLSNNFHEELVEHNITDEDDSNFYQLTFSNSNNNIVFQDINHFGTAYYVPPTGKNKKLRKEFYTKSFKFDKKITEKQLLSKRDEFWDTAPHFEGKFEIWNALRAAVDAAENKNFQLAQAIIDSANIILPNGCLNDCYDELGNRYQLPIYVLMKPTNLTKSISNKNEEIDSPGFDENSLSKISKSAITKSKVTNEENIILNELKYDENIINNREENLFKDSIYDLNNNSKKNSSITRKNLNIKNEQMNCKVQQDLSEDIDNDLNTFQIKIRLSNALNDDDIKIIISPNQTVYCLKMQIKEIANLDPAFQRMFFGGKPMKDREKLKMYNIYKNVVIQVAVNKTKC